MIIQSTSYIKTTTIKHNQNLGSHTVQSTCHGLCAIKENIQLTFCIEICRNLFLKNL